MKQSPFLQLMHERGHIHQVTDESALNDLLSKQTVTAYIGFDCTGRSLHVGSLIPIMMLRRLQQCGHKPVVLMGGGTTKVGDPSGKEEGRKILGVDEIARNKQSILTIFERFLTFGDGPSDAIMIDNADWLDGLAYIPFLRDIGKHFSVNRMLSFDSVRLRLDREQPLTFLEFNYMILQAYDFMELYKRTGCRLQMGGSDQWGNIVNGVELTRKKLGAEVFGLTSPLITLANGEKMGKTAKGAIWLNEDMLPAYDYWQYWRNIPDADVGRFLRLMTELPVNEIQRLEKLQGAELNDAKKILATEATTMARGPQAALEAQNTAQAVFETGDSGQALPKIQHPDAEISLIDALLKLGFVASRGQARRLIDQGGARVEDRPVKDQERRIALGAGTVKISAGKKRHGLIERS